MGGSVRIKPVNNLQMAETSRKNSEDDFLRVLEEMNRLCGEDGGSSADARQGDEQADLVAVVIADDDDESNNNVSKIKRRSSDDDDELDGIFASTEAKSTSLASGGLKCDQLLSSAAHSNYSYFSIMLEKMATYLIFRCVIGILKFAQKVIKVKALFR